MTIDLLEPVASLEEMEGSAVFPPRLPNSRTFRHEQMEISDWRALDTREAVFWSISLSPRLAGLSGARRGDSALVQSKFLKYLRLVSRMGCPPTPVHGVAAPWHPHAGGAAMVAVASCFAQMLALIDRNRLCPRSATPPGRTGG